MIKLVVSIDGFQDVSLKYENVEQAIGGIKRLNSEGITIPATDPDTLWVWIPPHRILSVASVKS